MAGTGTGSLGKCPVCSVNLLGMDEMKNHSMKKHLVISSRGVQYGLIKPPLCCPFVWSFLSKEAFTQSVTDNPGGKSIRNM